MDIENKDTKFRVFDKYSTGTAWGEGAGAVVLKPLDKALQDHDQIYAVIKGGAINNDGASNGITAPDQQAQTNLILKLGKGQILILVMLVILRHMAQVQC
ncbi:putative hybrid nonribosomal peptide synthetase/polyketide synthase [Streptococcus macacae NCTC 11558]|uniref:Beta-ketoacyl synthase, C-terminal domain protein n=1 Tax=Streptococcus macacae NCTC 11558 TaxID=764298 RepID=G5JW26_9STRE|nr:beta-ketoacyl synthase, C-terminal domain protein [Streptococcus macacae NCTC 11558]SUN79360.1 putative hybrid nonribosomal peptide synthetase/polyketide synthase [Streptococcus macacae NCTC 11558]